MGDIFEQVFYVTDNYFNLGMALIAHNHLINRIFIPIAKEFLTSSEKVKSDDNVESESDTDIEPKSEADVEPKRDADAEQNIMSMDDKEIPKEPETKGDVAKDLLRKAKESMDKYKLMEQKNSEKHTFENCASPLGEEKMDDWRWKVIKEISRSFRSLWKQACKLDEDKTRSKAQGIATLYDERRDLTPPQYLEILGTWYKINK